jgi:mannitol/fructose-specific phosphotransferase system IIA component (Ntr-type)/Kef-type K+ transport system membrane component KefB
MEAIQIIALGILLIAAYFGGRASQYLGMGEIIGQLGGGLFVNPFVLACAGLTDKLYGQAFNSFHFYTYVFLSLIAFTLGEELHFKKLFKVGPKAVIICFIQGFLSFFLISLSFWFLGFEPLNAMLIGSIGIATAPATIFIQMNQLTIEGSFRELLANIVVLADVAEILLFAVLTQFALTAQKGQIDILQSVYNTAIEIGLALITGIAVFLLLKVIIRYQQIPEASSGPASSSGAASEPEDTLYSSDSIKGFLAAIFQKNPSISLGVFTIILSLLCISAGLSIKFHIPFLLVVLTAGICISNFHSPVLFESLKIAPLTGMMNLLFFGLIGATIDFSIFSSKSFLLIIVYIVSRCIGKIFGTWLGARLTLNDPKVISCLPTTLLPQGGVAIVEVSYLAMVYGAKGKEIFSIVLPAVIFFEVTGIIISNRSLQRWKSWVMGEQDAITGKISDNESLHIADMMHPSTIKLGLQGSTKAELIKELIESFSLNMNILESKEIFDNIMEREALLSTCIGHGVAIPHCKCSFLKEPHIAVGTMPQGVDLNAHDKEPIKIIFLLITPQDPPETHLKALALISRILMKESNRKMLIQAKCSIDLFNEIQQMELSI